MGKYEIIKAAELSKIGRPVIVATFMRSGTHLTIDLLRKHFPCFRGYKSRGEPLDQLYLPIDVLLPGWEPDNWSASRALEVLSRASRPIIKTHFLDPNFDNLSQTQPELAKWLKEHAQIVYVRRGPKKVLLSYLSFLSDLESHDPTRDVSEVIEESYRHWRHHTSTWQTPSRLCRLEFEQIVRDPAGTIQQLGRELGEEPQGPVSLPKQHGSFWRSRLSRLFAREPESTSILTRNPNQQWQAEWDEILRQVDQEQPEVSP